MAAVNAAGFDLDSERLDADSARRRVRERLSGLDPDLANRLRQFYEARNIEGNHFDQQVKYVSYALLLDGPPQFSLQVPAGDVPGEALTVIGFESLVRELWQKGRLERLWQEVRQLYADEAESYRPLIREMILDALRYLRIPARVSLDRQVIFMPDLLNAFGIVNARNVGHEYFVVVGPSRKDAKMVASVRHEYLHFLLDPLVIKYRGRLPDSGPFLKQLSQLSRARQPYKSDFVLMIAESLVQATELRLNAPDKAARAAEMVDDYEEGLILAPYFDEALGRFEAGADSILEAVPAWLEGISWEVEQKRAASVAQMKLNSAPAPAVDQPASRKRALLEQANSLLLARRFDEAEPILSQVLLLDAQDAGALFGLAQIAVRRDDAEKALELYEAAAARAGEQVWIAAWCYVHRGNIFRQQGETAKARAEWSRVLQLKGDLHGAAEAAARALAESKEPPAGAQIMPSDNKYGDATF